MNRTDELQFKPQNPQDYLVERQREMGKAESARLNQSLSGHLNTIHETLQLLDQTPASSLDKQSWADVVKTGDQVSKQATIVGMLWSGEKPEAKAVEENMAMYFNTLQGLLLLSHGSMVGAGPTLSSAINASIKQVVDCSFKLMMETVSSYGSRNKDLKLVVPQLVGAVWEACDALKKTPSSNITAIGRAMTQVAVSVKDVIREMKELKPGSSDQTEAASDDDTRLNGSDNLSDELGNDLSPEEMKVAQSAIGVVSETVVVIKELIRTVTGLLRQEKPRDNGNFVDSLEKLLKLCQEIGLQIDELGASLYPPQEFPAMKASLEKISSIIDEVRSEVETLTSSSESIFQACNDLKSSMKQMEVALDCCSASEIESQMQNVSLS
ncbi:CYCLIN D1-BINDING PROTEIN 1 [Salix purpurea]|uniref:CYCLIN D1-BINDING PROTEIN 1 n=1 Tax=Salix purpurea TaxID=77065 RepID=A0A9Q0Z9J4_SALPP|nr:CYCLIN D1-BINDING PROTEIN 1 [Salix purpurea]